MGAVLELKPSSDDVALMTLWLDAARAGFIEPSRLQGMMTAVGHGA